ncbi:acetyl-CoA carboxylase biotin carboxyl carrier protein [Oculatella sp. LEGE 06141]|uniref:acetyl-CoA carboxylase biotin carboxyl carrier protein n=1 Tax=Oculatella sp. LEGE 06141 TaxID=1828648 RepID=UPI00187FB52C|nr:acetyl-CoA carboxylase biotin carboxyl carrier protein [Oculatella sp. LEGE 06141]
MELDFNELRELLAALNQTDIAELTLKSNDFELVIRKGTQGSDRVVIQERSNVPDALTVPSISVAPAPSATPSATATAAVTTATPAPTSAPSATERLLTITSPMVGTFYRSPAPDEPPFVEVGDRIRSGQTVCIIEAMKLMNEIEAEVSGEVVDVLVENGEPVEYGQVLMRVNPG